MPTGYRGEAALGYLQRVENALDPARTVHRENPFLNLSNRAVPPPSLPARPNQTEPHPSSTARSGGHSTGQRNSSNIVASQGDYLNIASRIASTDANAQSRFDFAAGQLEQVLANSYIMPQTSPKCQSGLGKIRTSLARFNALGERTSTEARSLGQNITTVS